MKISPRCLVILSILLIAIGSLTAQTQSVDVVYLKNGALIKGTILELVPGKTVKVQTSNGSLFTFNMSDVDRILKESVTGAPAPQAAAAVEQGPGTGFAMFGGVLLPQSELADKNIGNAATGFSAGLQIIPASRVAILLQASYSEAKVDMDASLFGNVDPGKWTIATAVAGLKMGSALTNSGGTWIAPLAGMMFIKTPESSLYGNANSSTSKTFAFGGQFGTVVGKSFTIFAQYLSTTAMFEEEQWNGFTTTTASREMKVAVINICVGIVL